MTKGRFIVFEGLDGCGTTTQANLLIDYLKKRCHRVYITKEPTNSIVGGLIRGQLKRQWKGPPDCLQLLFAADRAHHLAEIMPAVKKGAVVISDRYILSSLAYGGLELETGWLKEINKNFPAPALTIFIDTAPNTCIERMKKSRFSLELFEDEKKLKKVRENYLKVIRGYKNLVKVDGNLPINSVFTEVRKAVDRIL